MGLFTSWIYPVRGIVFLLTTPQLLQLVLRFLGIVTVSSVVSTLVCFAFLWDPQLSLLGRLLGINFVTKTLVLLLVMCEAAVPIYLVFEHRMEKLGRQLFDKTMQLKLASRAASAPASAASPSSVPHPVAPLQSEDRAVLQTMLTRQREQAAKQARTGLVSKVTSMAFSLAMHILFKPRPNESWVIRKGRDFATLGVAALLPGAALLLPLAVYRDSGVEVANLMSRYWEAKGVQDLDAQQLLVQQRMGELRGFGLVATGLSYVPILNWALALSNHVAAALYAAHLEARGGALMKRRWL